MIVAEFDSALSSRGLGRAVLIRVTGVQIPVAPLASKIMKLISVCFAVLLLVFASTSISSVFGTDDYQFPKATAGQINEAVEKLSHVRILPPNPLNFFISVKENITRFFNASAAKRAEFDLTLSGKRLKEAYLLTEKNDVKNASKALFKYSRRLEKLREQMEKAKIQNQVVVELSEKIADDMAMHERFLYVISQKSESYQNSYNFAGNFQKAENEFMETVLAIDNVKPGLKDRFPYLWD